jgi:hypothetical protein
MERQGLIVQCKGSITIFIAYLVFLSRPIAFGLRVFLVQASLATVASALVPQHEILLMEKVPTLPVRIERVADGGYLVLLDTNPNVLLKLDSAGQSVWSFEMHTDENAKAQFVRVSAEANGDALLCVARNGAWDLPSAMIRLNSQGREIARIDAQSTAIEGGPIYAISSCLRWGSGYVIVANEKRPSGAPDDYGKMSRFPFHTVVLRLRSDFTVEWRKAFAGLASPPGTPAGPKVLRGGDLIIPVADGIFRIDPSGTLKAQAKLGPCTWLRTINDDPRLRLACTRRFAKEIASTTIVEYDELLNIKNEIALYDNVGVPAVCELANGNFALLANDSPKAPFVQIYSAQGKALDKYRFPTYASEGMVVDGLPISATEFIVLRLIDRDAPISALTWMKAR